MPLLDAGHFQCLEAVACMFHSLEQAGPGGVSGAMHGGMELVNDCSHGHECCNGFLADVLWLHHCMDEISQWWKQGQYLGCHGTKLVAGPVLLAVFLAEQRSSFCFGEMEVGQVLLQELVHPHVGSDGF